MGVIRERSRGRPRLAGYLTLLLVLAVAVTLGLGLWFGDPVPDQTGGEPLMETRVEVPAETQGSDR